MGHRFLSSHCKTPHAYTTLCFIQKQWTVSDNPLYFKSIGRSPINCFIQKQWTVSNYSLYFKSIKQSPINCFIKKQWTVSDFYNKVDNPPNFNIIDNPPKFNHSKSMSCTHTRFTRCPRAHALLMPLHKISCYMHNKNYMQHIYHSCFILSIMLIIKHAHINVYITNYACFSFKQ